MKHHFSILFTLIFLFTNSIAEANIANNSLSIFKSSAKVRSADLGFDYVSLKIDKDVYKELMNKRSESLVIEIPYLDGETITLFLERYEMVTADFTVKDSELGIIDYTPGLFYRGVDEYGGLAAMSFFKDDIMGIVSLVNKGGVLNIGRMENAKSSDEFVMFNDQNLPPQDFECGAEKLPNYYERAQKSIDSQIDNPQRMMDCINMYLEGSYSLFLNKGSVTAATDYLLGMWNPVATIFSNEGVITNVSDIMIHSSPDGYSGSDGDYLDDFGTNVQSTMTADLGHLCYLNGPGGGLAWVDVLCSSPFYRTAYSNIGSNYNNFPSYSWTVNVVAHETGHNIGSPHTQSCNWPGGAIDGCVSSEGSCSDGPVVSCGTIMSYCHAASPFCIDFNQGFGPLPGNLILNRTNSASCLGGCDPFSPNAAPQAEFSAFLAYECATDPGEVWFTDESSNNPTSWYWEFEGGTPATSTDQNPIVTYFDPGEFTVSLTVTNAGGNDTETKFGEIEILPGPISDFEVQLLEATIFTTNFSQNADDYFWDFGNGDDEDIFQPVYTYEDDGTYTITLYAESDDCGTDTHEVEITVATPPVAGFSIDTMYGCAPLAVEFNDGSSSNVADYLWITPGADPDTSYVPNPVVVYNSSGVYPVTLIVGNPQGMDTLTYLDTITVLDLPTGDFTFSTVLDTAYFADNTESADSLYWDFGDGSNAINVANPAHGYLASGDYEVILHTTNECGTQYDTSIVSISLLPVAGFNNDLAGGCADLDVSFTNTSINADSISWYFAGGTPEVSDQQSVTVNYDAAGTYDVILYAFNELGVDTVEMLTLIDVIDVPSADFDANQNTSTNFDFVALDGAADSYTWDFGDGNTSAIANPNHEYTLPDVYTVTLVTENECGSSSTTQSVTVSFDPVVSFEASGQTGCVPYTVQYQNTSFAGTSFEWTFPGGTPASSTDENPTVIYETAGVYDVTLEATNQFGTSTETYTEFIAAEDVPMVDFSYNVNGAMVEFMAIGNADTWSWDFGDGMTGMGANVNYTFDAEDIYNVTLIGSNGCGEVEQSYEVVAYSAPTAGFSLANSVYCVGEEIAFENNSSDNSTSYSWNFEGADTASSSEENPIITYSQVGTYDVSLTVSNPVGEDVDMQSSVITIMDVPTVAFSSSSIQLSFDFENLSEGSENCVWDFGDGNTSTDSDPSHTYTSEGEFTVTLTCENMCGQTVETQTVTASLAPSASFTYEILEPCAPATIQFTSNSNGNVQSTMWTFEGGNPATSDEANPTVTFNNAGDFNVSLTVSDGITSDVATDQVVVLGLPESGMSLSAAGPVVTGQAAGDFDFEWQYDGNIIGINNMLEYTFSENGTYEIILEATNECGTSVYAETVEITAFPNANFTTEYAEACAPAKVDLIGSEVDGGTYLWTMNGGAVIDDPTAASTTATIENSGNYTVSLSVSNEYGSDSYTETNNYTIIPLPYAQINFQFIDGVFTGESDDDNATEHEWDFGNGDTASGKNIEYTYETPGVYLVTLSVSNACGTDMTSFSVEVQTSDVEDFESYGLNAYPNPIKDVLNLSIPSDLVGVQASLVNVNGKVVYNAALTQEMTEIDTEYLSAGVYVLYILSEDWQAAKKVIKID